jgi:hypothetical protein
MDINDSVLDFFARFPYASELGRLTDKSEFDRLPKNIFDAIPNWYKDLLTTYPIANLEIAIPNDFGQAFLMSKPFDQLPLFEFRFFPVDKIVTHSTSFFPGFALFSKKFITIAEDHNSTGEGIFIDTRKIDPIPYLVFHDTGNSPDELLQDAEVLIDSFSSLFKYGRLHNEKIRLNEANRVEAEHLIKSFFSLLDSEIAARLRDNFDKEMLKSRIGQRDKELANGNLIKAFLRMQYGLYDCNYPVDSRLLMQMETVYNACGLYLPELVYFEERVSNHRPFGGKK